MKNYLSATLALLLLVGVGQVHAVTYCGETITSSDGTKTVELTCTNPSTNTYVMALHSDDGSFSGISGDNWWCYVNGSSTYHMTDSYSWDGTNKILTFTISSTTVPRMYTPIYLNFGGEKTFTAIQNQTFEWPASCEPPKIYFVNTPNWGTPYAYLWDGGNNNGWPGTTMTNTGITTTKNNYSVWSIDFGSYVNAIFSNNGSNQSGDQLSFTEDRYFNYEDNKWYSSENTLNINAGGWQTIDFEWVNLSKTTVTAEIDLAASTTYEFYLHGTDYFKNDGTMTSANCTEWKMDGANNCHITTQYAGTYTFNYDFATNHLSVVYPDPAPASVPADPDDLNDCQVKSIFGASSFRNAGVTLIEWDESLNVAEHTQTIAGKDVLKITFSSARKTMLKFSQLDLTAGGYTHVHFDVWSPVARDFASSILCNEGGYKGESVSHVESLTAGTWKSVDFALSSLTDMSDYYDHAEALIVNMGVGTTSLSSLFYIANLYFYKTTDDETCYADCGLDVARAKQTWAGCYENASTSPDKAVDGTDAMWQTGGGQSYDNQWWVVDLGHYYKLDQIEIKFENARTKHMLLQTRKDAPTAAQRANSSEWTTIVDVSGANDDGSGTILGNYNSNIYDVSSEKARYIRFKSEENTHSNNYGCKIRLFKVCVTGFASDDPNPPVMSTATYVSNNVGNTGVILELTATDEEGDVNRFRLNEVGGGSTIVNTDASDRVTIDGLSSGQHTYQIYAIDEAGNVSANYVTLSVCFLNPAENLALNKTSVAGWSRTVVEVNAGEVPGKANDGIGGSGTSGETEHRQWAMSVGNFPTKAWWAVDLGTKYQLSDIDLYWNTGDGNVPRSYIIQVATETPADFANDAARQNLVWETVTTVTNTEQHTGSGSANRNRYSYTSGQNVVARYVRIVNLDDTRIAMYLREVEVFGRSGKCDNTAPVMVSADYDSYNVGNTGAIVTLHGDDETSDDAIAKFKLVEMNGVTPVEATYVTTNAQHKATIDDLTKGTHVYHVYAVDTDGNVSANYEELTFCFNPTTLNIALNATTTAGYTEGGVSVNTSRAVDGDLATQWQSTGATAGSNEWFTVDLGQMYDLYQVKVRWGLVAGNDDGGDYPTNYKFQVSNNNSTWASFAHYNTKAATGDYQTFTTTDPLPARYVRIWVDAHDTYAMGIRELEVYSKNDCYTEEGKPVITLAEVKEVHPTSVEVHCESWANGKTHDQLRYYYELYKDGALSPVATGTKTHTSGDFTFSDLAKGSTYSAKIWAEITSGSVRSDNYKVLNFSVTYSSLHYLTEEAACNWMTGVGKAEWQFKYTDNYSPTEVDGSGDPLQILEYTTHTISTETATTPPTIQYKLYESEFGGIWTTGGNLYFRNPKDKLLKMYALGTDKFVSNLDELYVSGEAVGGWWTGTNSPSSATAEDYKMEYDTETGLFSWTGDVTPGAGKYFKIVVRNIRGVSAAADTWDFNRIMASNKTYERDWTRATLYFDMSTWTWWWEIADATSCRRTGGAGSGVTVAGATPFSDGYFLVAYTSGDNLVIEAETDDDNITNAYLWVYSDVSGTGLASETAMTNKGSYYQAKVSTASVAKLGASNIVRYGVKFAGEAGLMHVTEDHYYDCTGDGSCSDDYFDIYHWDDAAAAPDGARTSYAGGTIMQPIRYFRHFEHTDWCTISLPFEVSKVVVYDEDDETEYPLYPRFDNGSTDKEGYYWLKTFTGQVSLADFKGAWQQLTVSTASDDDAVLAGLVKPAKNTPYAIAFPDGSYYGSNWVIFYGAAGQTIATDFTGESSITLDDGYHYDLVQLQANNTMHPSAALQNVYLIEEGFDYFTRRESIAVPAFEAYVIGTHEVQASYAVLRTRGESVPTGVGELPKTDTWKGDIYTVTGVMVASFDGREALEQCTEMLATGVYVVRTSAQVYKIVVP